MPPLGQRLAAVLTVQRWAAAGNLWAILDATDAPSVLATVTRLGPTRAVSLYRGGAEEDLAAIAPYLVHLDELTFQWITEDLWPQPWGILAVATAPLESLRLHFRRFLVVESPEGEDWYFRFYDPRVLVPYLASCTPAEATHFFGPVRAYAVTDPATYGVTILAPGDAAPAPAALPAQPIVIRR